MSALRMLGRSITELKSQQWDSKTSTIGGIRDYKLCTLSSTDGTWSFLLLHLNSELGDPLAAELSKLTPNPVLVFYEFDQCAWGLSVYEMGARVRHFWNRPEAVEEDPQSCSLDPEYFANHFGVEASCVARYLQHIEPDSEESAKASDEDQFALDDHWVRCDFMRQIGLPYPDPGTIGTRHVYIEERGIN